MSMITDDVNMLNVLDKFKGTVEMLEQLTKTTWSACSVMMVIEAIKQDCAKDAKVDDVRYFAYGDRRMQVPPSKMRDLWVHGGLCHFKYEGVQFHDWREITAAEYEAAKRPVEPVVSDKWIKPDWLNENATRCIIQLQQRMDELNITVNELKGGEK